MTSQKLKPDSSAEKNLSRAMYLPRMIPSTSLTPILTWDNPRAFTSSRASAAFLTLLASIFVSQSALFWANRRPLTSASNRIKSKPEFLYHRSNGNSHAAAMSIVRAELFCGDHGVSPRSTSGQVGDDQQNCELDQEFDPADHR